MSVLEKLVEPTTRGDPESPLRWTCKSLRTLADELSANGYSVSYPKAGDLLRELSYGFSPTRGLSHDTALFAQPQPILGAKPTVLISLGIAFTIFLPEQKQRNTSFILRMDNLFVDIPISFNTEKDQDALLVILRRPYLSKNRVATIVWNMHWIILLPKNTRILLVRY